MTPEQFLQQTLTDIKIKLTDEFDMNFQRKAFFNEKWASTKLHNHRGSLMMRTGNLRSSMQSKIINNSIVFTSSMPYANIQNNGGEITVTPKMKKYFWAKHLEAKKANKSTDAQQFKAMALKKVGDKIKIPKRQFIGHHPEVDKHIRNIINHNLEELSKQLKLDHKQ